MEEKGYLSNPQNDFERELRDKFLKEWDDVIKEAVRKAPPSRLSMAMLEAKVMEQEREIDRLKSKLIDRGRYEAK